MDNSIFQESAWAAPTRPSMGQLATDLPRAGKIGCADLAATEIFVVYSECNSEKKKNKRDARSLSLFFRHEAGRERCRKE